MIIVYELFIFIFIFSCEHNYISNRIMIGIPKRITTYDSDPPITADPM
jgi:hypothetical protein